MEHKRGMRLMLSCTVVLVVGVTSVAKEREGEREREFGLVVRCLSWPPPRLSYSACLRSSPSPCVCSSVCLVCACLFFLVPCRKALDIPFYRHKEMAQLYNGV
jgi:hypothetical protein